MSIGIGGLGNILGGVVKKATEKGGGTPTTPSQDAHEKTPAQAPSNSCPTPATGGGAGEVGSAAVSPAQTGKTIGGAVASVLGGNHTEQAPTEHYPNHFN